MSKFRRAAEADNFDWEDEITSNLPASSARNEFGSLREEEGETIEMRGEMNLRK